MFYELLHPGFNANYLCSTLPFSSGLQLALHSLNFEHQSCQLWELQSVTKSITNKNYDVLDCFSLITTHCNTLTLT